MSMGDTRAAGTRRRPWLAHPVAVVALALLFLAPVALLTADAARSRQFPEAVAVMEWQAQIVAVERGPERWRVSGDGGLTWRPITNLGLQTKEPTRSCAPEEPAHCYRVVPGHLRVEETVNGGQSWWIAWSVPDNERRRLGRCYQDLGEPAKHLSSRSLAVAAVPGGHAVVVANGRDGYAVRAPDGTWTRTGFGTTGTTEPPDASGAPGTPADPGATGAKVRPAPPIDDRSPRDAAPQMVVGLLAGLAVIAVAGSAAVWRVARRPVGVALPLVAVGGLLAIAGAYGWRDTNAVLPVVLLTLGLSATAAGAVGVLVIATLRRAVRKLPAALAAGIGIAVATADAAMFGAWAYALVGYRSAALAGQALAVTGLIAAVTLVVRKRPTPQRDNYAER